MKYYLEIRLIATDLVSKKSLINYRFENIFFLFSEHEEKSDRNSHFISVKLGVVVVVVVFQEISVNAVSVSRKAVIRSLPS